MANEKNDNHTLLNTDIRGDVKIADDVVAQIAAIAAEEVEGVGVSAGNLGSTLMAYVGVKKNEKKVRAEVVENIVHVEMTITVLYGYNIPEVSRMVQEKVKAAIENMTGLSVTDIDVRVSAIDMEKGSEE
ncbi:MAG: Asp23/Gls24 family envelope stress response protein [Lachnospiraceae bacterium]|nr:Asp23/Gls24 family envelope stress response protein [Lachnospiraceae bacterium]